MKNRRRWNTLGFLVLFFLLGGVNKGYAQAVWHVNTIDDNNDGNCNAGHCSLREALEAANFNMGPDSILFNIPGAGPYTITPNSPLPAVLDSHLVIDATTQSGNLPTAGMIRIDGTNLASSASHGLVIYVRHVRVTGLQIQNFPGDGIQVFGGFLDDQYIDNITIGAPQKGNILISNGGYGLEADVDENFSMQGNYIGTNTTFDPGLGNDNDGALIRILSADNSQIGGAYPSASTNYFCSNEFSGLHLDVIDASVFNPAFRITGNVCGTGAAGTEMLGNRGFVFGNVIRLGGGILISGAHGALEIGGSPGFENILAYNYNGVVIDDTQFKTISYNRFYCNENQGISLLNTGNENMIPPYAFCLEGDDLQGFAEPNASVTLYTMGAQNCPGECQGYNLLGTATADGTGAWSYANAPLGTAILGTATNQQGSTSEFSFCLGEDTVSVAAASNGPVCEGDFISLSATPSRSMMGTSYAWVGPGGYSSPNQNPSNATEGGIYKVYIYLGNCIKDSATVDVTVLAHGRDTITDFCLGDSWTINGNTYDENNTQGTEILPGAAANGCDSIVVFDMVLNASILGRVYVPEYACAGEMITAEFEIIPLNGPYDVTYQMGSNPPVTLNGIFDGHTVNIPVTADTEFRVLNIETDLSICFPIIGGPDTVHVSDIQATPVLSDYNGWNVNCPYDSNGTITLNYTGAIQPAQILWADTTLTDPDRTGLAPGLYQATITDISGCAEEVNIQLTAPSPIQPVYNSIATSCYGAPDGIIDIQNVLHGQGLVSGNLDSIFFFDLDNLPYTLNMLPAGNHTLSVEDDAGCMYQYNVSVQSGPMAPISVGQDQRIAKGDSLILGLDLGFIPATINWDPAAALDCATCPNPTAFPEVTTEFSVVVVDSMGCISEDELIVHVYIPQNIYIPNVFSPNGDGRNDVWYIQSNESVMEALSIFVADRRGTVVHQLNIHPLNDPGFGWDGTFDGEPLNPGVFTYAVRIKFLNGQERWYTGDVTLVR